MKKKSPFFIITALFVSTMTVVGSVTTAQKIADIYDVTGMDDFVTDLPYFIGL